MTVHSRESGSGLFPECCYFDALFHTGFIMNCWNPHDIERQHRVQLTKNGYHQNAKVDAMSRFFFSNKSLPARIEKDKVSSKSNPKWNLGDTWMIPSFFLPAFWRNVLSNPRCLWYNMTGSQSVYVNKSMQVTRQLTTRQLLRLGLHM